MNVRVIVTYKLLESIFSKYGEYLWPELVVIFAQEFDEAVFLARIRCVEFKALGGPDEINPWFDLERALRNMTDRERLAVRNDCRRQIIEKGNG
jgi:hypothetical protein